MTSVVEPETQVSLRQLVKGWLDEGDGLSKEQIADEIVSSLHSDTELRAALRTALPVFITQVSTNRRNGGRRAINSMSGRSKWDAVGEYAAEIEYLRIEVMTQGTSKPLGDCGVDDLVELASRREKQAKENLARAEEYRAFASALAGANASTVGELPLETVRRIVRTSDDA